MTTLSVFKACGGGYVGTGHVHPAVLDAARETLAQAKADGVVADGYVARCGDDVALIVLHDEPPGPSRTARLAREAFARCTAAGRRLRQHLASSNGAPVVEAAEMRLTVRPSEPVVCFLADKAAPGSWNLHLYRIFADPFNTPSLIADSPMRAGFRFTVRTGDGATEDAFDLPDDLYRLLATATGSPASVVSEVRARASGEPAAAASMGPDPALLVRCHDGLPSVGEALEAFAFPYAVAGWHGAYAGPLVPVSANDDMATRLDGPPRAIGLGFQVTEDRLIGPRDLLADHAFDEARRQAHQAADYLRRHGPFPPHRVREAGAGVPLTPPV